MHKVGFFVLTGIATGVMAFVGCSSTSTNQTTSGGIGGDSTGSGLLTSVNSTSPSSSTATATSTNSSGSSTVVSSTETTTASSGVGGGGGVGGSDGSGGGPANFTCTLPTTPPSNGSCVTFTPGDAGVDDAGDPSNTNCNPVTNAGCTGTDVCEPDFSDPNNMNYFCQGAGSPAGIIACGDCSADTATCGPGAICIGVDQAGTEYFCAQMCCSDADCGSTGTCDMDEVPLPSGVGLCIPK